jgi:hypothetical protein
MANPTTNLNITLPEPGVESSRGTWGTTINDAIQSLDTGIADRGVPAGGTDDQILTKNGTDDYATEWATRLSSVAVTGSDGIEVDSGSPLTANGTIALGVNKSTMLTFLNAEDGATADQTNAEIKTAYEANSDTNALTDALQTKLNTAATTAGSETLTNKTLTSPVLNTGVSGSAVLDSDTMSGASATTLSSSESIKAYVDAQTHEAGDVTSVVAGSGLTGGGLTGDVTLNVIGGTGIDANADDIAIDATVATLTGSQTLTNKTLTAPLLGTPTSGVMTNVTGTAASLTAGTATNATNVTVAAELIISSQAVSHQVNANSTVLFSCANHGLADDQPITFTLGTNPPDGVTSGTIYYVRPGLSGSFSGGLTGTANTFTLGTSPGGGIGSITTTSWEGSSSHVFNKVRFPLFALAPTGDLPAKSGGGLTLTAEGKLTSTTFAGDLTGDVTGALTGNATTATTATTAIEVAVVDESTDTTCFPLFVATATGSVQPKSGTNLSFNSNTGVLTASGFAGALTGNADTVTTNANLTGDVTSSGNVSTIADGKVNEAKLHVSNTPTDGYVLTARSAAAGDMTWEASGGSFEPLGNSIAMSIALG